MNNIISFILIVIPLSVLSQTKEKIKLIYQETHDIEENEILREYLSYNKEGDLIKEGEWKFDSITNKRLILPEKKQEDTSYQQYFNLEKKLASSIQLYEKGLLKGLILDYRFHIYDSSKRLIQTKIYTGDADTTDLGFHQINFENKLDREQIKYKLSIDTELVYNQKGDVIKLVFHEPWLDLENVRSEDIYKYKYNSYNEVIEEEHYSINIRDEDNITSRDNTLQYASNDFVERINYSYKYDQLGNWVEKEVYNYDYLDPLLIKITREIEYYK